MKIEFEAKFFPVNKELLAKKLQAEHGQLLHDERLMRRVICLLNKQKSNAWLRIRDEGDIVTVAIKEVSNEAAVDGTKESEIVVNKFEEACELFTLLGFTFSSYQENKRATWLLDGAMLTIDTWPGLEPLLEIEGKSAIHVKQIAEKLGYNFEEALFGGINSVFQKVYGLSLHQFNAIKLLDFATIDQVILEVKNTVL